MVDGGSELLEERIVVLFRRALLHNDGSIVLGDFVNHKGGFICSSIIEETLERSNAFIRDINTISMRLMWDPGSGEPANRG